jgi:chitin synthase
MFRVYTASDAALVVVSPKLIKEYGKRNIDTLHLKNLLSLGEDRYLTTLILKLFPAMRTRFTSDAKAMTSAPDSWSILLSQRRRWINSVDSSIYIRLFIILWNWYV